MAEDINKEIISTLVLNNIQKKFKVAVIKYTSIQFLKTGILEDLALLTHSNYFCSNLKSARTNLFNNNIKDFSIEYKDVKLDSNEKVKEWLLKQEYIFIESLEQFKPSYNIKNETVLEIFTHDNLA